MSNVGLDPGQRTPESVRADLREERDQEPSRDQSILRLE